MTSLLGDGRRWWWGEVRSHAGLLYYDGAKPITCRQQQDPQQRARSRACRRRNSGLHACCSLVRARQWQHQQPYGLREARSFDDQTVSSKSESIFASGVVLAIFRRCYDRHFHALGGGELGVPPRKLRRAPCLVVSVCFSGCGKLNEMEMARPTVQ